MSLLDHIRDAADALTEPHMHSEPITFWDTNRNRKIRHHRTIQPGLLAQLYQSVIPASSSPDGPAGGVPGSRPPLAVEALSTHDEIAMAALHWCQTLNLTLRVSVESNIRALVGAAGTLDDDNQRRLLTDLRRWERWSKVLTGWETIYRPAAVTCPAITDSQPCGQRSTLRINLTAKTGMCRACGATWSEDDGSITVLADYIRTTTDRHERVA